MSLSAVELSPSLIKIAKNGDALSSNQEANFQASCSCPFLGKVAENKIPRPWDLRIFNWQACWPVIYRDWFAVAL